MSDPKPQEGHFFSIFMQTPADHGLAHVANGESGELGERIVTRGLFDGHGLGGLESDDR